MSLSRNMMQPSSTASTHFIKHQFCFIFSDMQLYFALLWLCAQSSAHFTFSPIPDNTPMIIAQHSKAHVSYDTFKILFYVNLEPYYRLKETIENCTKAVENVCKTSKLTACDITLTQLKYQMESINEEDDFIHSIKKRFILCEFCGKINHFVYGVMDAETARKYDNVINSIENATISNHELLLNQSRITESFIQYNNITFKQIENALNHLKIKTNENEIARTTSINELYALSTVTHMIQVTQLAIAEYNRYHGKIRRTLTASKENKFIELIPKEQLSSELKHIATSLKNNQRLPLDPFNENVVHIYSFCKTQSTLFNKKLMVEISIPIADREEYTLFKATPIPVKTQHGQMLATVSSTFFLLNSERTKYIALTEKQLKQGHMLSDNETLYQPTSPAILRDDLICEWKIMAEQDFDSLTKSCNFMPFADHNLLISITENELYFTTSPNGSNIWEKCGNDDYTVYHIPDRGTIQIDPECAIKTSSYIIQAHKIKRIKATKIITPTISTQNLSNNYIQELSMMRKLNFSSINPIVIHNQGEIEKLAKSAHLLVTQASHEIKLEKANYESTQMSIFAGLATSGSVIGVLILTTLCICWRINLLSCLINCLAKRTSFETDHHGVVTLNLEPRKPIKHKSLQHLDI